MLNKAVTNLLVNDIQPSVFNL